ncbi:MAG: flavin reductase family protein [Phycisphaeraceae bacterium]
MNDSQRAFRQALGLFPTGVTIITALDPNGERLGMTVNSFNTVSLDPPLVLFSIARNAYSMDALLKAKYYAVNLLDLEQTDLSTRFARALGDKWTDVNYHPGRSGVPLLDSALAWFECESHAHHDGGDHVIFVGRVLSYHANPDGEPLVFFRGQYNRLYQAAPTPSWVEASMHGW